MSIPEARVAGVLGIKEAGRRCGLWVYLDTEFTDLNEPNLLSVGMVSEGGDECYAELELGTDDARDRMRVTSEFVHAEVLTQWDRVPGAACSHLEIGRHAGAWMLDLAAKHGPIELLAEAGLDFELLLGALRHAGLVELMSDVIECRVLVEVADSDVGQRALSEAFERIERARGLRRHHALADSHALLLAHFAVRGQASLEEFQRSGASHSLGEVFDVLQASVKSQIGSKREALQSRHASRRRIISLDFDGVTHPSPEFVAVSPVAPMTWIDHLARILESHPDVGLLVHSSWRETYSVDEIQDMLHPMEHRFAGVAPSGERGASLAAWRSANAPYGLMLVIDDDLMMRAPPGVAFLRCDPRIGLSAKSTQNAIGAWLDATRPGMRNSIEVY